MAVRAPSAARGAIALIAIAPVFVGAAASSAQSVPAAVSEGRTEILFLGTAGGPPLRADRSEPSTLLSVDGRNYLIDCGIGTAHRMVSAGIRSEQVRTIFFTHLHADHDLGLADVMANDFLQRSPSDDYPINIYGPPQTRELVDAAFRFITIGFRPFAAENQMAYRSDATGSADPFIPHEIDRGGSVFQDDKILVTAAENSHYALMPQKERPNFKSYSYRIETPHGVVVLTGDTGPSDALTHLATGADVLIAEASFRDDDYLNRLVDRMTTENHWSAARANMFRDHFRFEHLDTGEIGQLAAKAVAKAVILYHYYPADKADQQAYIVNVKKHFSGPVFAPDDLDRYCIRQRVVERCK